MKKTYINPEMEVVEMKVQQMLAASVGISSETINPADVGAPEFDFMPETMPGMPSFVFE